MSPSFHLRRAGAFTLIEILAAVAVLLLLVTLLMNMIGQTTGSIRSAGNRIDASDAGRTALDRMSRDLQLLVSGGGATVVVGSNGSGGASNEFIAFLSRIRGPNAGGSVESSRITALLYAIQSRTDKALQVPGIPMLDRLYAGVPWESGTASLPENALAELVNKVNAGAGSGSAFDDRIFRMAVVVQIQDGSFVTVDQAPRSTTFTSTPALAANAIPLDLEKAKAVVVAVAVLDLDTRIKTAGVISQVAAALPKPVAGKTPIDTWQAAVDAEALKTFSLPVQQNVRFYQRIFPLK